MTDHYHHLIRMAKGELIDWKEELEYAWLRTDLDGIAEAEMHIEELEEDIAFWNDRIRKARQ